MVNRYRVCDECSNALLCPRPTLLAVKSGRDENKRHRAFVSTRFRPLEMCAGTFLVLLLLLLC